MATWPASIPQYPLIEGYEQSVQNSRLESQPDQGASKIRNRFTATLNNVAERYIMDKTQFLAFITFYEDTLSNGALTFVKEHPIYRVNKNYRIAPGTSYSVNKKGVLYEVALELQIMPD